MRNLQLTIALVTLVILQLTIVGCQRKVVATDYQLSSAVFPADWVGEWQGQLEVYKAAGKSMEVPMQLTIANTADPAKYSWIIKYGVDTTADERLYELLVVDAAQGHYQIDEKNTIIIDSYLFESKLISAYEVMGNAIDITYEYHGDRITFDLIMCAAKEGVETGGSIYKGDDIPTVTSYPVKNVQRAVLRRVEPVMK